MIIGNAKQQELLKTWLEKEKQGTFLIYGPEGVGKFSFCLEYLNQKKWEKIVLKTEDNILKISSARFLTKLTRYKSEKRVVLVDNVDKFQKQAQNTLLKTLEEPLTNTIFVLVTHQLNKILPTIRSRSLILKFNLLSQEETIKALELKGYNLEKVKFFLDLFPGQPGKIVKLLEGKEKKANLIKKYFSSGPLEKIMLLEELKKNLSLKEFLEIYLLIKRKEVLAKGNLDEAKKLKEILSLYFDADYNLNFELQLANLILNYG